MLDPRESSSSKEAMRICENIHDSLVSSDDKRNKYSTYDEGEIKIFSLNSSLNSLSVFAPATFDDRGKNVRTVFREMGGKNTFLGKQWFVCGGGEPFARSHKKSSA
jgi:hypothetical protein